MEILNVNDARRVASKDGHSWHGCVHESRGEGGQALDTGEVGGPKCGGNSECVPGVASRTAIARGVSPDRFPRVPPSLPWWPAAAAAAGAAVLLPAAALPVDARGGCGAEAGTAAAATFAGGAAGGTCG